MNWSGWKVPAAKRVTEELVEYNVGFDLPPRLILQATAMCESFSNSTRARRLAVFVIAMASAVASLTARAQEESSAASAHAGQRLWFGAMDIKDRIFRFAVTTTDGINTGKLQSLDEGGQTFQLTDIALTEDALEFKLPASKAAYTGKRDGERVDGKWSQSGMEFDLSLKQVDALPQEELTAYWTGTLDAVLQKLDLAFRERTDGVVLFDSVTQKAGGFVANKKVDGKSVTFDVPSIKATFSGEINEDGSEIVGKWKQGLWPLSLKLTKSQPRDATSIPTPKRPQMPKAPFPYAIEEVSAENPKAPEVTLSGTLTIPEMSTPVAAVILISGSGPQDRDETIVDHKPFWVIADYLTRQGFAVLRYDDRGVGKSTGKFDTATTVDFASDAKAMVAFLRGHKRVAADKIALCGHSEGALVVPMVAAGDPQIAGLILLAGPGVNGEKILISQARLIMQARGIAENEIEKQAKLQKLMIDLVRREPPLSSAEFNTEANQAVKGLLSEAELASEQTNQMILQSTAQLNTPWFRFFLTYEPAPALAKVTCPVLVLNGELDMQVEPQLNVEAIKSIFAETNGADLETHILPRLNHLFQTAQTGNVTEYAELEETFSPHALELMSDWLNRKVR